MIVRLLAAAGLVAAGIGLAACQTTPAYSTEADRACREYGLSPGTAIYEDCFAFVQQALVDAERDFEDEYGEFNPRLRCEVTDISDQTVHVLCDLI